MPARLTVDWPANVSEAKLSARWIPPKLRRRHVLQALGAAILAAGADAVWWEPRRLVVERLSLRFPDLPVEWDGLRLLHLTDLHRSSVVGQEEIEEAVSLANSLRPDLVLLTGDYLTGGIRYAPLCAAALSALRAPLGRCAVLGNHDHWAGADQVAAALQQAGLTVLRNQAVAIGEPLPLWVVGVDDAFDGHHDLGAALQGVPSTAFKIALIHEPDLADAIAQHPVQLQLSGHSHGGQVRLPAIGPLLLPRLGRKYPMGLRRVRRLQLYTSRGVGRIKPAVRFLCPPEVTLLTLRRA